MRQGHDKQMQQLTAVWSFVRWAIVAVVIGGGIWLFLGILLHEPDPENVPSWLWYGNWRAVLIVMYVWLARREDAELAAVFGAEFLDYEARTPAFIPWGGKGARVLRNDERSAPPSRTAVPEPAAREHQE